MNLKKLVIVLAGVYSQFTIAGNFFQIDKESSQNPFTFKIDDHDIGMVTIQNAMNQTKETQTFLNSGHYAKLHIDNMRVSQNENGAWVVAKNFIANKGDGQDIQISKTDYHVLNNANAYFMTLEGSGKSNIASSNIENFGTTVHVYNPQAAKNAVLNIDGSSITSQSGSSVSAIGNVHVQLVNKSTLTSHAKELSTLYLKDGAMAIIQDSTVYKEEDGQYNPAIYIGDGSSVEAKHAFIHLDATKNGEKGQGSTIYLQDLAVFNADSTVINVDAPDADGVVLNGKAQSSHAHFFKNNQIIMGKNNGRAIRSFNSDLIVDNGGLSIVSDGENSDGVSIRANQSTKLDGLNIMMAGKNSDALYIEKSQLSAQNFHVDNSQFTIAKGNVLSLESVSGDMSFSHFQGKADSGNVLLINNQASDKPINTIFNDSALTGDVVAKAPQSHMQLNDASHLTGAIHHLSSLALDRDSWWLLTDNSEIDGDVLNDQGAIYLNNNKNGFHTLTIEGDLKGKGNYVVNVDIAQKQNDLMQVKGQVKDTNHILVNDVGHALPTGEEKITLVSAGGDNAGQGQFALLNENGYVDLGNYKYVLTQQPNDQTGTKWILENTKKHSDSVDMASNLASIGMIQSFQSGIFSTLRQRMGALRALPAPAQGGWVRSYGSRTKLKHPSMHDLVQTQNGIALGFDQSFDLGSSKIWTGIQIGQSNAKQDLGSHQTGKAKQNNMGVYASFLSQNQVYLDLIMSYGKQNQSADFKQTDGQYAHINFDQNNIGLGIELGKTFDLNQNWFVEPQMQLNYLKSPAVDYSISNGMQVKMGKVGAFSARFGALLGQAYQVSDKQAGLWYVKLGSKQVFRGNRGIELNQKSYSVRDSGHSIYAGLGINQVLNKSSQFYADIDFERGRNVDTPWSYSIGLRKFW